MKTALYFTVLLIGNTILAAGITAPAKNLSRSQACAYIIRVIDNLLAPQCQESSCVSEIKQITKITSDKLLTLLGDYSEADFWSLRTYNQEELHAGIISELIQFIKTKSFIYARAAMKEFFLANNVDEKKVAQRISMAMADKALKKVNNETISNTNALEFFVGSGLKKQIRKNIKQELMSIPVSRMIVAQPKANLPTLYATRECPLCNERFSDTIKRIFMPCGHNGCEACLKKRYNRKKARAVCPYCMVPLEAIKDLLK